MTKKIKQEDANKAVSQSYTDTQNFLLNNTAHWSEHECCGSFIAFGTLTAVIHMVMSLAPSEKEAVELVHQALNSCIYDKKGVENGKV